MAVQHARLTLPEAAQGVRIEIDGRDIAKDVRALSLTASVDEPTRLVLDLPIIVAEVEAEVAVDLAPRIRDLLVWLGWTPPAGEDLP